MPSLTWQEVRLTERSRSVPRDARTVSAPPGSTKAAEAKSTPTLGYTAVAYVLVIGGAVLGWVLNSWQNPSLMLPGPDVSAFAVLFVFTQALERLLEPFTTLLSSVPKAPGLNRRSVGYKHSLDVIRQNRAVIMWAVASVIAMSLCGAFGVLLLQAIGVQAAPIWLDIAVTGLAIGSGTKPLHDLIKNMEKAKEGKEAAA